MKVLTSCVLCLMIVRTEASPCDTTVLSIHNRHDGMKLAAHVCIPPKSASTSFLDWLYTTLTGESYPADQWNRIHTMLYSDNAHDPSVMHWNAVGVRHTCNPVNARLFAIMRDPVQRFISGYRNKLECGGANVDARDTAQVLGSLVEASSRGEAYRNHTCMSMDELLDVLGGVEDLSRVNVHFRPQSMLCGKHYLENATIMHTRSLHGDVSALLDHLRGSGLETFGATMKHDHSSAGPLARRAGWRGLATPELRCEVAHLYADDYAYDI